MKIAMLEPLAVSAECLEREAEIFKKAGHEVFLTLKPLLDSQKLEAAKDADVLIIANSPLPAGLLESSPKVKMISVAFTGVDHLPAAEVKARGITVSNSQGYATIPVAELVFGAAITLLRNVIPCDAAARAGKTKDGLVGTELYGKRLGIIGFGAIGRSVAKIGQAFGCETVAFDVSLEGEAGSLVEGTKILELDDILATSDIISLHVPLTPQTRGLIGKEKLGLIKKTAVLINMARGPVVDSQALADALNNGDIAGAALDVFDVEPPLPLSEPLLGAKNTVLTPHIGFASKESMVRRAGIAFGNISAWLAGEPRNVSI
ncbi:MAG: hydroxyacid dehydrogenase [Clostridiales bacterium]|jgi:D-3-phosphoglycerate dehydrogenase|nr:hydroxyacid dehydrogenase [Clostridiales bacterium]